MPETPERSADEAAGRGVGTPARPLRHPPGWPSRRLAVLLAAGMLGMGIAVGAAIGPGPDASFAGGARLPLLLGSLLSGGSARGGPPAASTHSAAPTVQPAPEAPALPASATPASAPTPSSTPAPAQEAPRESQPAPAPTATGPRPTTLAPVTSVWLIELSGESFGQALAQPTVAPYMDTQLIPTGTLLSGWSALAGSAFAGTASLAGLHAPPGSPSPILETIVQPPCPEGAAGSQCAPGTPGALTTADQFAKQAVAQITANPLYREHGLIVLTFGSVIQSTAAGLPQGAAAATLTAQPPAGVVLLSPFARAGARSSIAFNATSPQQTLEGLLHK